MTSHRFLALLLLGLCAFAAPARAEVYCVADAAALRDAISDASFTNGDHHIRIRTGTIHALADAQSYYNAIYITLRDLNSLTISGGWSGWNGACTTQTMDARLTTIDAESTGRIFHVIRADNGTAGFTLRNLTLRRGRARDDNGMGGCLAYHATGQTGNNVFENLIASDCEADASVGALALFVGKGTTVLRNVLLRNNRAQFDSAMLLRTEGTAFVSNLSAVGNHSEGGYGTVDFTADGNGVIVMSNSLFADNLGQDATITYGEVYFVRNLYREASIGPSPTEGLTAGNLQDADPGLAADGVRLGKGSVLIDYGVDSPFGGAASFDLEGNPRIRGAHIDVGAIEYTGLFSHGFE